MKVISAITMNELTDVLMNLVEDDSIEFEYEVHENAETGQFTIECKMFDTEFFIMPLGGGPFYEDLLLTAFSAHISTLRSCAPSSTTDISSHRQCRQRSSQKTATTKMTAR